MNGIKTILGIIETQAADGTVSQSNRRGTSATEQYAARDKPQERIKPMKRLKMKDQNEAKDSG